MHTSDLNKLDLVRVQCFQWVSYAYSRMLYSFQNAKKNKHNNCVNYTI
jgi:hypothetical protein